MVIYLPIVCIPTLFFHSPHTFYSELMGIT
jgi:hypothetical protein